MEKDALQMMLKKEVAEPDESSCEDNEGGHSQSIAMPAEEVATETTAGLEPDNSSSSQLKKERQNGASNSILDAAAGSRKSLGEEPSKDDKSVEGYDDERGEDKDLEEPLLSNGHRVSNTCTPPHQILTPNPIDLHICFLHGLDRPFSKVLLVGLSG